MFLVLFLLFVFQIQTSTAQQADVNNYQYKAAGVDNSILQSDRDVAVSETSDYWLFAPAVPAKDAKHTSLIFLPGGSVEPKAYAQLCRAVALSGYKVFLAKLPPLAPPLDSHKAKCISQVKTIISANPKVERWVVVGHSLGAAITSQFAFENPKLLDGYILIATTHPTTLDLSQLELDATKIYGTNDGVAQEAQIKRNERLLPKSTRWVRIEGGNHRQFGWYSGQNGDNEATISHDKQQEITVEAIRMALDRVNARAVTK